MSKVFMITEASRISAIYYVAAESAEDADEYLREQIRKYFFKAKLSKKHELSDTYKFNNRVIIDGFLTETMAGADYDIMDVTPMAYMKKLANEPHWVDFDVDIMDCADWKVEDNA